MVKILQYNIYFGDHYGISIDTRLENICSYIISVDADVVCLQEVIGNTYDMMKDHLKETYPYMFPEIINKSYDTVILSKHPIIKKLVFKYEFTSMGRDLKIIMTRIEDQNMYICTSHFESEFTGDVMKKKYQYKRCADILMDLYKKTNIPIFLCADINICKKSEYTFYNTFTHAKGWKDTWIENGSKIENEITFDPSTNPILIDRYKKNSKFDNYKSRLDIILHLSEMYSVQFQMIGTGQDIILSDHYGIVSVINKNKPVDYVDYIKQMLLSEKLKKICKGYGDDYNKKTHLKKLF